MDGYLQWFCVDLDPTAIILQVLGEVGGEEKPKER